MALQRGMCCLKNLVNINTRCLRSSNVLVSNRQLGFSIRHLQTLRPSSISNYRPLIYSVRLLSQDSFAKYNQENKTEKSSNIKGLADQLLRVNIEETEQEKEEKKKDLEKKTKYMNYSFIFFGLSLIGGVLYLIYSFGEPPRDEDGNLLPDEHANKPVVLAYFNRAWDSVRKLNTSIIEPHNEMLLGPPLESPYYQPPYTLVLEMTDILIHPEWTFDAGWRFKKRPGLEYFLQKANFPNFEVVIYTKESYNTAMPLVQYLSSLSALSGFISRENTHYIKGTHVKDLSRLNRDLSKVIYIDWNSKASHLQPDNLLRIPRWNGDDRDATLVDLADMLTTLVSMHDGDIRPTLQYYSQFDNPLSVYKENKRKLREQQEAQKQDLHKAPFSNVWRPSLFPGQRK